MTSDPFWRKERRRGGGYRANERKPWSLKVKFCNPKVQEKNVLIIEFDNINCTLEFGLYTNEF